MGGGAWWLVFGELLEGGISFWSRSLGRSWAMIRFSIIKINPGETLGIVIRTLLRNDYC